jgi:hypothetical protein
MFRHALGLAGRRHRRCRGGLRLGRPGGRSTRRATLPADSPRRGGPVRTSFAAAPRADRHGTRPHRRRAIGARLSAHPRCDRRALAIERGGSLHPRGQWHGRHHSLGAVPLRGSVSAVVRRAAAAHPPAGECAVARDAPHALRADARRAPRQYPARPRARASVARVDRRLAPTERPRPARDGQGRRRAAMARPLARQARRPRSRRAAPDSRASRPRAACSVAAPLRRRPRQPSTSARDRIDPRRRRRSSS